MNAATAGRPHEAPRLAADPRWAAVIRRDRGADGTFYYSVRTTGVYCRPSCAARRPNRENVQFHRTRAEAERAGFRPCMRCRPDQPALGEQQAATIAGICRRLESAEAMPGLAALAKQAGLSLHHFHRVFKKITGLTPREYAGAHRATRVRAELKRSRTVTDAIYESGFSSDGRFYATSDQMLGMTPTEYRKGGAGMVIRFAVGRCSLGSILVAKSAKGVCAILLGDDPDALVRAIHDTFPRARLLGGDAAFERVVARVVAFVEAPALGLDLPLDVRGTAFQHRVWQALRDVPAGTTVGYADIAKRIGSPGSARAVARACAANTLAVAIPCHRVVRTDGGLAGYRWGAARKRALLKKEGAA
jgi:AraC family transcriptional regulator, regulatory protein of adaptative response / methylated-DNA-[protein]-cysteine methyltransferase